MNLIIKPTGACNFNCKFCSAHDLDIKHPRNNKVPYQIKELVRALKPSQLIITGGEPLMVDPEYYYELHAVGNCLMSMTTNLKGFYEDPRKWAPLFKEPWMGIATSFNYGDTRMWDATHVYTEEMFIKVMDKYSQYVGGQIPAFLAVIDENNEDTVMDHVLLAKRLGTVAKINNAIGVGKQGHTYPRYKMFRHYIEIIDAGLEEYEYYCSMRNIDECPRNLNFYCTQSIRCCYIDDSNNLHVGICDEQISMGKELPLDLIVPTSQIPTTTYIDPNQYIDPDCPSCELFALCNGCLTNRGEAKRDPNYCKEMKKLESDIIRTGWLL